MSVEIEYIGQGWANEKEGRLLGLMTPKQFASVRKGQKESVKFLITGGTVKLDDVRKSGQIKGKRLAIAIREKNDQKLLVTAELEEVLFFNASKSVTFKDVNGSRVKISEVEEKKNNLTG